MPGKLVLLVGREPSLPHSPRGWVSLWYSSRFHSKRLSWRERMQKAHVFCDPAWAGHSTSSILYWSCTPSLMQHREKLGKVGVPGDIIGKHLRSLLWKRWRKSFRPSSFQSIWHEVAFSYPHVHALKRNLVSAIFVVSLFQLKLNLMYAKDCIWGETKECGSFRETSGISTGSCEH